MFIVLELVKIFKFDLFLSITGIFRIIVFFRILDGFFSHQKLTHSVRILTTKLRSVSTHTFV